MIAQNIGIKLNGNIFAAFQIFCAKRGCENSAEGLRMVLRETQEYRELTEARKTEPEKVSNEQD